MTRRRDIEVYNGTLEELAPETALVRDRISAGDLRAAADLAAGLEALAQEDRRLAEELAVLEADIKDEGRDPARDPDHRDLRAARLFLRETVAEVSEIGLRTCGEAPGSPQKPNIFTHQRGEFWSARTGLGPESEVLMRLPTPKNAPRYRNSIREYARQAALIAPFRVARSDEELEMARANARLAGEEASRWEARALSPDRESEALEWWIDRAVKTLEAERKRDLLFYDYLLSYRGLVESAERLPASG